MKKLIFVPIVLLASPALAHVGGDGAQHHLVAGFSHPFSGLDHMLAMIAVGLVAAFLGGRSWFAMPATFLAAMLAGFGAGAAQLFTLPAYEAMIVASVIGLGLALLVARPLPLLVTLAITAIFGFAHGFAHGVEGALTLGYATGFLVATAILHGVGLAAGVGFIRFGQPLAYRIAGGVIAAIGVALAML